MTRGNDQQPVPGEPTTGAKRTDPDAHTNPDAAPAGPVDREREMADIEGTGADVPNVGAAGGASNAGRSRMSGGDS